jgi:putative endonuclease
MSRGFVYILSNYTRTTFYVGVTADLPRRLSEHLCGFGSRFAQRYNLKYLVHYEEYASIVDAIAREKQLKSWHRQWKINLIRSVNPDLKDLSSDLTHLS